MPRESHKELDRRIERLNSRYSLNLSVNHDSAGIRVEKDGRRYLSPRQSLHSTMTWLEAFEVGIEVGEERTVSDMRKGRVE